MMFVFFSRLFYLQAESPIVTAIMDKLLRASAVRWYPTGSAASARDIGRAVPADRCPKEGPKAEKAGA